MAATSLVDNLLRHEPTKDAEDRLLEALSSVVNAESVDPVPVHRGESAVHGMPASAPVHENRARLWLYRGDVQSHANANHLVVGHHVCHNDLAHFDVREYKVKKVVAAGGLPNGLGKAEVSTEA